MLKRGRLNRRKVLRKRRLTLKGEVTDKMLDDACRAVVFARDGHKCRKTGSTARLQWAHVYSRRYRSIRWDPDNSLCLSAGAHLWWHHQPVMAALWWVGEVGVGFDVRLRARMGQAVKQDRKATLLCLRQELKRITRTQDAKEA